MKNTIIALACVLISSTTFAASITHGSSHTVSTSSGTYVASDRYASVVSRGGSYSDGDGGTITVSPYDTVVKKNTYISGETASAGQSSSDWINASGLVWGDTSSFTARGENVTGCTGSAYNCNGTGVTVTDSTALAHTITTEHGNGMTVTENVTEDRSTRRDEFTNATISIITTDGIFME